MSGMGMTLASHYSKLFEKHEISFDMISELNHELLLEIGIWKVGHRIMTLRTIKYILSMIDSLYNLNYVQFYKYSYISSLKYLLKFIYLIIISKLKLKR